MKQPRKAPKLLRSYKVTKDMLKDPVNRQRFYGGGKELQENDTVCFGFVMNSANLHGNPVTILDPEKDNISMSMMEFVLDKTSGMMYQLYAKPQQ